MSDDKQIVSRLKGFLLRREVIITAVIVALLTFLLITRGVPMILTIFIDFAIFAIVTLSLNLEVGYTGISQFGRVLAVMAGAFGAGAIPGRVMAAIMGLPWGASYAEATVNFKLVPQLTAVLEKSWFLSIVFLIFCLLVAALCGAGIGWLTSRPAIRLKEAYLGISLLAFGDLLMWIGHNWEPLVGATTSVYIPDPFRFVPGNRFQVVVITVFVIAFLIYFFINTLTHSPFGRTLKMVRDNEISAAAAGKDVVKIRTRSLMIGSAIAAIGGALYVIYTGAATAIGFTRLTWTFWPWAFMMLGGIGSNLGVLLGVFLLTILRSMITIFRFQVFGFLIQWGIDPTWLEFTLMGAVIIVVVLFLPHGLVPEKVEPVLPADRVQKVITNMSSRGRFLT
ncbi:MAG TPA: branched-chain amino acid ABC transporter permease [Bacillota bacterium]|nr:branched-chain amino acid ABC transporter permease [Bacillota bacterium]